MLWFPGNKAKSSEAPGLLRRAQVSLLVKYHSDKLPASEWQEPTLHLMSAHYFALHCVEAAHKTRD
jgi:hypothetical protein